MAEITAAAVKALREKTDLPMMECKKALTEAGGDEAKAIQILKEMFKKVQEKRADNVTAEGRIFIAAKPDGSEAAMVEMARSYACDQNQWVVDQACPCGQYRSSPL